MREPNAYEDLIAQETAGVIGELAEQCGDDITTRDYESLIAAAQLAAFKGFQLGYRMAALDCEAVLKAAGAGSITIEPEFHSDLPERLGEVHRVTA
jgi:hypothetical protein